MECQNTYIKDCHKLESILSQIKFCTPIKVKNWNFVLSKKMPKLLLNFWQFLIIKKSPNCTENAKMAINCHIWSRWFRNIRLVIGWIRTVGKIHRHVYKYRHNSQEKFSGLVLDFNTKGLGLGLKSTKAGLYYTKIWQITFLTHH